MNRRLVLTFVLMSVMTAMAAVQEGDEAPPRFTASGLLTLEVAKGPHYRVDEDFPRSVIFTSSVSRPISVRSRLSAAAFLRFAFRNSALAAWQDVSKTEVFLSAAGKSVVKIGQGAAAVVTDPAGTVKGVGAGIKRFGVNLGRRTERAVSSSGDTTDTGNAGSAAANSVLGVSAAVRRWAQKVGADPYTTNTVLQKALADVAKVDAAG